MSDVAQSFLAERENAVAALAKNLVLARTARGTTQEKLAEESGVSRATIAQIESGESDPRLSTIVDLAAALELSPLLLLLNERELAAIAKLVEDESYVKKISSDISTEDVERMRRLIQSGVQKGQKRAAELGASAAQAAGFAAGGAAAGAAIGTILFPGIGTAIGAALGSLLYRATANARGGDDND
jgi:transcriptional regulator with XRE-family HTH domain